MKNNLPIKTRLYTQKKMSIRYSEILIRHFGWSYGFNGFVKVKGRIFKQSKINDSTTIKEHI